MIRSLQARTKVLRSQPSIPVTFTRQKSITAAIERGKRQQDITRVNRGSPSTRGSYRDSARGSQFRDSRPSTRASYRERAGQGQSTRWSERPRRDEGFRGGARLSTNERYSREDRPQRDRESRTEIRPGREDGSRRGERSSRGSDSKYGVRRNSDDRSQHGERPWRLGGNQSVARRDEEVVRSTGFEDEDASTVEPAKARYEQPRASKDRSIRIHRDSNGTDIGAVVDNRRPNASFNTKLKKAVPDILPYTTAASEFLYGHSVVLAALKANRRQLYNLYIHERGQNHEGAAFIASRARNLGLSTHNVGDEWSRVLDRASSGRPHNGFILEASPLPRPPITQLGPSDMEKQCFTIQLDKQSKEDALVNGNQEQYEYNSDGWRYPLVLYADGVLDEGNLGAIARSAYFLGVDAVITPTRQSAPWSHIALKASAGAAEAIPIFCVNQAADFLSRSAREGWRIYASDAIPPQKSTLGSTTISVPESNIVYTHAKSSKPLADHHPVASHPTILMMGAEGSGLRNSLLNQAHYKIGIRAGRYVAAAGVDSLNVSVAASLLCFEVLKKPMMKEKSAEALF